MNKKVYYKICLAIILGVILIIRLFYCREDDILDFLRKVRKCAGPFTLNFYPLNYKEYVFCIISNAKKKTLLKNTDHISLLVETRKKNTK